MLTELHIENFAIIQKLDVDFAPGLITFTGETGAGKSIILDAIMAVIGGRADATNIRSGADRALVEATFELPEGNRQVITEILEREDLLDDPNYLTLGRELRREGRSTGRINGRAASIPLMREVGSYLVDIHGQSEHLSLLNVRSHIGLLDRFAKDDALLSDYRKTFHELQTLRKELTSLRQMEQDAMRRTDLLNFQVQEIESAQLDAEEEEALRQERSRLANAENLSTLTHQALTLLEESTPETPALSDQVGQLEQALISLSKIDSSQASLASEAETLADGIADLTRLLQSYLEKIEYNPHRLEQVEDRLALISNLKRKYGSSVDAILAFAAESRKQLETIAHASERIEELEQQENSMLASITAQAQALSAQRMQAAEALGKAVEAELGDLNMAGARFSVDIRFKPDPGGLALENGQQVAFDENGVDQVEFLIAPNPGEGLKPLVKIASGGETSRLMLALKNVLAEADVIPTLIFDEIDQGIGGRVGFTVGEKLWRLGRKHQVLCVTHLPQLAAFGDNHFRVQKQVIEGRTITQVDALDDHTRLDELALMLGGASDANRNAAQETLTLARRRADAIASGA
ncbi:MAG TPA: DNA repair protein RecN [Longilinea sp.]|nr:DNA repair protein RecN [Longilinea sp.]